MWPDPSHSSSASEARELCLDPQGAVLLCWPSSFPSVILDEIRNPTLDGALQGIPGFAARAQVEKKVFVLSWAGAVELSPWWSLGLDNGPLFI